MPKGSLSILMYHSIDETSSVISTAPSIFRRQMEHLWRHGFLVLTLSQVVDHLRRGESFPEKSITLTFDDGFANTYTTAFPLLQQYGFSATIFPVTGYVGRLNDWPGQPSGIPPLPLLSWAEMQEMSRYGIQFGSHAVAHPLLPEIPLREAEQEIWGSKAEIEDHLQKPVEFFAYPYGRYDPRVKDIVRRLFQGACSTHLRQVHMHSDPWALERIDVNYLAADPFFKLLSTPLLPSYLGFRNIFRSLKERLPGRTFPMSAGY